MGEYRGDYLCDGDFRANGFVRGWRPSYFCWGALVWHVGASIFAYGVVVFLLTYIFNIGKPASND